MKFKPVIFPELLKFCLLYTSMSGEIMEVKIYSADMETGTASRLRCACRKDMITKPHFYIRWSW